MPTNTLSFLLFNLSCFNFGIARRLAGFVRDAGDPDVLLFNEVPIGRSRAMARALGPEWTFALTPSARFAGLLPFRQAILARAPRRLEFLRSVPLGMGRKLLVTRLSSNSRGWIAAIAHLSAELPSPLGRRRRARERQVDRLIQALRPLAAAGEPIVLGGDFNFLRVDGGEPEHERASGKLERELGLVDVAALRASPEQPGVTWPSEGHPAMGFGPQRLDLFYASADLATRVRDFRALDWTFAQSGSDHRPLRLELELD